MFTLAGASVRRFSRPPESSDGRFNAYAMNQDRQGDHHQGQVNQLQGNVFRQPMLDGVHQIVERTNAPHTEPTREISQPDRRLAAEQAKVNTDGAGDEEQKGGETNRAPAP